jgi:hypothetical protein
MPVFRRTLCKHCEEEILEPIRPDEGGVCQALWEHGSVCERKPDYEVYVPSLGTKPFVLCDMHKSMMSTCFSSVGIFFKILDHQYKGKQGKLV